VKRIGKKCLLSKLLIPTHIISKHSYSYLRGVRYEIKMPHLSIKEILEDIRTRAEEDREFDLTFGDRDPKKYINYKELIDELN
jgi:hypothetical protein